MQNEKHWELRLDDDVIQALARFARTSHSLRNQCVEPARVPLNADQREVFDLAAQYIDNSTAAAPMIDDYLLEEFVGRGGYSVVYRARNQHTGETVALKVLTAKARETSAELCFPDFDKGVRIVAPQTIGRTPTGLTFLTMLYLPGGSLHKVIASHPNGVGTKEALRIVREIAQVLVAVHEELELVHFDLKPENVLLDDFGYMYVADFGLAVGRRSLHSMRKSAGGTVAYMAPEVLDTFEAIKASEKQQDKETDEADLAGFLIHAVESAINEEKRSKMASCGATADIYSVGIIFYELLTGVFPKAERKNDEDTIVANSNILPDAPRVLNRSIPADVSALCLRCLEANRGARPQSAQDLIDEIDGIGNRRRMRTIARGATAGGLAVALAAFLLWPRADSASKDDGLEGWKHDFCGRPVPDPDDDLTKFDKRDDLVRGMEWVRTNEPSKPRAELPPLHLAVVRAAGERDEIGFMEARRKLCVGY